MFSSYDEMRGQFSNLQVFDMSSWPFTQDPKKIERHDQLQEELILGPQSVKEENFMSLLLIIPQPESKMKKKNRSVTCELEVNKIKFYYK